MHWGVGGCIVDLGDGKHNLVSVQPVPVRHNHIYNYLLHLVSSLSFVPAETGTLDHLKANIVS